MRNLKKVEADLIAEFLKDKVNTQDILENLPNLLVEEMNDGGMGSLKFIMNDGKKHSFCKEIAEITLLDIDGVPVSL